MTAVKYALAMAEKTPFHMFFKAFYFDLRDYTAVKLAVENFPKKPQTPSGRQKLIVTVAQMYAETLLLGKNGKPACFGSILDSDMPLKEMTINAVEFCQGSEFSFQKTNYKNVHIGNRKVSIPREEAAKIRLADIVAASHCIPLVFEPMAFPDDFVWPDGQVPPFIRNLFSRDGNSNPVALMDGGLLDNQAIDGLLLNEGRNPHHLGMHIVSDASLLSNNFYPLSPDPVPGRIKLGHINRIAYIILGLCLLTIGTTGVTAIKQIMNNTFSLFDDGLVYLLSITLATITGVSVRWAQKTFSRLILDPIPQIGTNAWFYLKQLKLTHVLDMIKLRFETLLVSLGAISQNRIQTLQWLVYRLAFLEQPIESKRVSNFIFHLRSDIPFSEPLAQMPGVKKPSRQLQLVANVAATARTAFWADHDFQLPCMIACGQATMCYNLMKYIVRRYGPNPDQYSVDTKRLWDRLLTDWNDIVSEPYALISRRLPDIRLPLPPESFQALPKSKSVFCREIARSPDGRYVLLEYQDKTIRFWDIESGRKLDTFMNAKTLLNYLIGRVGKIMDISEVSGIVLGKLCLSADFGLDMDTCLIAMPPENMPGEKILEILEQTDDPMPPTCLVISISKKQKAYFAGISGDIPKQIIIAKTRDMIEWLVSTNPLKTFEKIILRKS